MKKYCLVFFCLLCFISYSQNDIPLQSIKNMDSIIRVDPSSENYYYRGYFRYQHNEYAKALEDYNMSISLDPSNFQAYYSRGMLKDKLDDSNAAVDDYTKCIAINNESAKAYFSRGFSKSKLEDYKGAIEDYSHCIEINPKHKGALLNRGILYKELKKFEEALIDHNKAIGLDPAFIDAIRSRAILNALMDKKEAIDDFNSAILLEPDNGENHYNRAVYLISHKVMGNYCADLRDAIRLGFTPAKAVLAEKCIKKI